jgi:hypothetical protein
VADLSRAAAGSRRARPDRWSSACRARRGASRSSTAPSASCARRTCRRSSATTAGRRSSRPTCAPSSARRSANGRDPLDVYRARYAGDAGAEPLARLQDVDLGIYLVDDLLVKTDRMSMAHSLEARVPYLDTAVARLAMALPTRPRCAAGPRSACCGAPRAARAQAIVAGRKQGFSIPAAAWLRGPLEPFAREVLAPARRRDQGLLDPGGRDGRARRATSPARRTSADSCGGSSRCRCGWTGRRSGPPARQVDEPAEDAARRRAQAVVLELVGDPRRSPRMRSALAREYSIGTYRSSAVDGRRGRAPRWPQDVEVVQRAATGAGRAGRPRRAAGASAPYSSNSDGSMCSPKNSSGSRS